LNSVVVKSVDAEAVRRAVDAFAADLLRTRPDVAEIVVFGSFEQDRHAPGSDVDVLIVLEHAALPVRDRVADLLPARFPVGLDLFPFTRAEIEQRRASPLLDAVRTSAWRYRRPGTRVFDDPDTPRESGATDPSTL